MNYKTKKCLKNKTKFERQNNLQLPMQSVPITMDASSNPTQGNVYNFFW